MNMKYLFSFLIFFNLFQSVWSNTKNDPHAPITHCYHWLDQASKNFLSFKYTYAKSNGDELAFFTTGGNGAAAGPGLYCGKTPADSYSYGDRVIRVNFVEDVVLWDSLANIKYCGNKGETSQNSEVCAKKTWDVKFYSGGGIGNTAWYVIQNPMAIDNWSANNDILEEDLKLNATMNSSEFKSHVSKTLSLMYQERSILGKQTFNNRNARFSIINIILKDPAKLDSIPPLNIVTRVSTDTSNLLSEVEKIDLYKKFIRRSLGSNDTEYSELLALSEQNKVIKNILVDAVADSLQDMEKQNPVILLGVIASNSKRFSNFPDADYQKLVSKIFASKDLLAQLAKSNVVLDSKVQAIGLENLRIIMNNPSEQKSSQVMAIPTVMKLFANPNDLERIRKDWKSSFFLNSRGVFGIGVGSEELFFKDSSLNLNDQCQMAISLSDPRIGDNISLIFKEQKIALATFDPLNLAAVCKNVDKMIKIVKDKKFVDSNNKIYFLVGRAEAFPFMFVAEFSDDLDGQCAEFHTSSLANTKVDDIYVSLNGQPEKSVRNSSSYWITKNEVCGTIVSMIGQTLISREEADRRNKLIKFNEIGLSKKSANLKGFLIEGSIEHYNFSLYGLEADEIYLSCIDLVKLLGTPRVDDISWRIDGKNEQKLRNSSAYWTTDAQICNALCESVKSVVPTKKSLERAELLARWEAVRVEKNPPYQIRGSIQGADFIFFGQNRDEIINQCKEFYPYLGSTNIDSVKFSVNSSPQKNHTNSRSYWKTADEFCSSFGLVINDSVPSVEDLILLGKRNEINEAADKSLQSLVPGGFSVKGSIEEFNYHFFGKNSDEIKSQCISFFSYIPSKTKFDDMTFAINGQPVKVLKNSQGYWNTASLACSFLVSSLTPYIPAVSKMTIYLETLAQEKANFSHPGHRYKLSGSIGNYSFYLYGENFEDMAKKCNVFAQSLPSDDDVTDFKLKMNEESLKTVRFIGKMTQVCTPLIDEVEFDILSQEEIEFQSDYQYYFANFKNSQAPFKGKVKIGRRIFYFHGKDVKEIKNQCIEFFPELKIVSVSAVKFQLNNKEPKRIEFKSPLSKDSKFCKELTNNLKPEMVL